ncbi:hypothetical protein TUM19329_01520 [Legionella antarctica]|uniref:Uncharacterized protein n=1 Tax=Legionella antarctica TaxID=2708020 RepID=A0A6F8T002_9GAMM|nr:hypothetical protein [Legionella antarctica]BCA93791.1 hypothetical protein TUM19329_01520 [Legionella antarctica]
MKTVFLDTSTINEIHDNGFKPNENNFIFYVGPYVTYELSKAKKRRESLFKLITTLKPFYLCQRAHLYKQEVNHLIYGESLAYTAGPLLKEAYDKRMSNPALIDQSEFRNFIEQREEGIRLFRDNNYQNLRKHKLPNFNEFKQQFFSREDLVKIVYEWIYHTIKSTKERWHVEKILHNINSLPAHRTLINTRLYLYYLALKNGAIPARNRFADSLQLIEASHSSVFASNDKNLLKIVPHINPDIELMTFQDGVLIPVKTTAS